jgi:hypothetical protein
MSDSPSTLDRSSSESPARQGAVQWVHGQIRPQAHADSLLTAAGLSAPLAERLREIVRRTRLWSPERAELMSELITHVQDAAEAGKAEEMILASLGEPREVSGLIRRSAIRKRSPVWKARIYAGRALAGAVLVMLVIYGALAVRFFTLQPRVEVDYFAAINARTEHLDESERAWKVYEDVQVAWRYEEIRLATESTALHGKKKPHQATDSLPFLDPTHSDTQSLRQAIIAFRSELDKLTEASRRPALGFPHTNRIDNVFLGDPSEPGDKAYRVVPLPIDHSSGLDGSIIYSLLPMLGPVRHIGRVTLADAVLSAEEENSALALERLLTAFALSSQISSEPFLISNLVAVALHSLSCQVVMHIVENHPGLFDASQLTSLAHAISASHRRALQVSLDDERMIFDDLVQRAYSDNSRGDGRLTPQGAAILRELDTSGWSQDSVVYGYEGIRDFLMGPALSAATASKSEVNAIYTRWVENARQVLHEGPHSIGRIAEMEQRYDAMSDVEQLRFQFLDAMLPSFSKAIENIFRARTLSDATMAVIAVESYRLREGRLPSGLDQLVPRDMPSLPSDPFDMTGSLLYLQLTSETFFIYSRGEDGDDDQGREASEGSRPVSVDSLMNRYTPDRTHLAHDGDWILYPRDEN